MNIKQTLCAGLILVLASCAKQPEIIKSPFDSVDPFIGTGFHGHTVYS